MLKIANFKEIFFYSTELGEKERQKNAGERKGKATATKKSCLENIISMAILCPPLKRSQSLFLAQLESSLKVCIVLSNVHTVLNSAIFLRFEFSCLKVTFDVALLSAAFQF